MSRWGVGLGGGGGWDEEEGKRRETSGELIR